MLSDDFVAERHRPDVCKIVLALDTADSQPVRFDCIMQPQMRHIHLFHFANSMSMKNVFCRFCGNDQYWLYCKPNSLIMPSTLFASDAPNAAAYSSASAMLRAMMFLFFLCTLSKSVVLRARLPRLTISSFLFTSAQSESEKLSPLNSCSRLEHLDPLPLSLQVPNDPLQFGEAIL